MADLPGGGMAFLRAVLDAIPSFVLAVDEDVRILDYNAAASALLDPQRQAILSQRSGDVMNCLHSTETQEGCGHAPACRHCIIRNSVREAIGGHATVRRRIHMQLTRSGDRQDFYALISATPFQHEDSGLVLLVIEDIGQLAELQRIVPICTKCKKVRDDDQYWQHVESYFQRHWDLQFTHSYCPECLDEEMDRLDSLPDSQNGGERSGGEA
jgi:PAS domain-containing protein